MGQRGAAKILWGSPVEQTREKMFVIKWSESLAPKVLVK
jgi:hypothetical protein